MIAPEEESTPEEQPQETLEQPPEDPPPEQEDPPKTAVDFQGEFEDWVERAKEAGAHPMRVMIASYQHKAKGMIDAFLSALEDGDRKPEKKS